MFCTEIIVFPSKHAFNGLRSIPPEVVFCTEIFVFPSIHSLDGHKRLVDSGAILFTSLANMETDIDGEEADVVELAPSPVKVSKPIDVIWDDDKIEKVSLRAFIPIPDSL